jgi:hypothetical protein
MDCVCHVRIRACSPGTSTLNLLSVVVSAVVSVVVSVLLSVVLSVVLSAVVPQP